MLPFTDPADTANAIANSALTVSVVAGIFAFLAAGFAAWQAVTMHLERTKPRPAALTFLPAQPGETRLLKNEGGSAAHELRIFAWGVPLLRRKYRRRALRNIRSGRRDRYKHPGAPIAIGKVAGSLSVGATAPMLGVEQAEMFDPPSGIGTGGLDLLYSPALLIWKDSDNRERRDWVPLR